MTSYLTTMHHGTSKPILKLNMLNLMCKWNKWFVFLLIISPNGTIRNVLEFEYWGCSWSIVYLNRNLASMNSAPNLSFRLLESTWCCHSMSFATVTDVTLVTTSHCALQYFSETLLRINMSILGISHVTCEVFFKISGMSSTCSFLSALL